MRPIRSSAESGFQLDSLANRHTVTPMYNEFRLAKNSTCAGPSGTLLRRGVFMPVFIFNSLWLRVRYWEGQIQPGWIGIEHDTSASVLWPLYLLGHNTNKTQENSETLQQRSLLGYNSSSVIS